MQSQANTVSSTSLSSPTLSKLADSAPHEIDAAVFEYIFIELVRCFKNSATFTQSRLEKHEQEMIDAGLLPASVKKRKEHPTALQSEPDQALLLRIEIAGEHVGANLSERLARDRPRFSDHLDAIKFVCKDVWIACWGKQVDNLRTNHRGVYIIQDNSFRPILRISSWEGQHETLRNAKLHVNFAIGVIRGVILRLGLNGTVTVDITNPPQCGFQIKLSK